MRLQRELLDNNMLSHGIVIADCRRQRIIHDLCHSLINADQAPMDGEATDRADARSIAKATKDTGKAEPGSQASAPVRGMDIPVCLTNAISSARGLEVATSHICRVVAV